MNLHKHFVRLEIFRYDSRCKCQTQMHASLISFDPVINTTGPLCLHLHLLSYYCFVHKQTYWEKHTKLVEHVTKNSELSTFPFPLSALHSCRKVWRKFLQCQRIPTAVKNTKSDRNNTNVSFDTLISAVI